MRPLSGQGNAAREAGIRAAGQKGGQTLDTDHPLSQRRFKHGLAYDLAAIDQGIDGKLQLTRIDTGKGQARSLLLLAIRLSGRSKERVEIEAAGGQIGLEPRRLGKAPCRLAFGDHVAHAEIDLGSREIICRKIDSAGDFRALIAERRQGEVLPAQPGNKVDDGIGASRLDAHLAVDSRVRGVQNTAAGKLHGSAQRQRLQAHGHTLLGDDLAKRQIHLGRHTA